MEKRGAVREEWGAVKEEWGTTCLLFGCTQYQHLGDKDIEQGKVPVCPSQGLRVHRLRSWGAQGSSVD